VAAYAELEGEVFLDVAVQAVAALAERCEQHGVEVHRVLDLGSGPGVGTCCLAQRFASATVVAVDGAAPMLARAADRAARLGLAPQVETRLVELPDGFEALGRAEVAWASMSLHHLGDEGTALARIRALLEPGGLFALVERGHVVRVLPEDVDLGRPGIWERLDAAAAAWFTAMRADLPGATPSAPYAAMLGAAGFEVLADEVLTLALDAPLDAQARQFAHRHLVRARPQLAGYADAADLDALDVLLDTDAEDGVLRRADLTLRATRQFLLARAPSPD
jgi:SAM-dependent methyltransferase